MEQFIFKDMEHDLLDYDAQFDYRTRWICVDVGLRNPARVGKIRCVVAEYLEV